MKFLCFFKHSWRYLALDYSHYRRCNRCHRMWYFDWGLNYYIEVTYEDKGYDFILAFFALNSLDRFN